MITLRAMIDTDFAWLLGDATHPDLVVGAAGISPPGVIALLRGVAAGFGAEAGPVAWMIVEGKTVVGMISFIRFILTDGLIAESGEFEFGYGVAPEHEGRGIATAAVAALIEIACARSLGGLTAATGIDNRASQRVLEKNGFTRTGTRHDPEDGALIIWAIDPNNNGRPA